MHLGGLGYSYGGAVNIPVSDTFAMRVMGFNRHSAGWVDDLERNLKDVNQLHQDGGRFMALWQPGDWKISGMGVFQDSLVLDSAITDNRNGNLSRSNTPQASPVYTKYHL